VITFDDSLPALEYQPIRDVDNTRGIVIVTTHWRGKFHRSNRNLDYEPQYHHITGIDLAHAFCLECFTFMRLLQ
jgi:hypothetical protein